MTPFLVIAGEEIARPIPRRWALKPVGLWNGREAAVAYDPRRYDAAVLPHGPGADTALIEDMRECGWEPHAAGHAIWQTR